MLFLDPSNCFFESSLTKGVDSLYLFLSKVERPVLLFKAVSTNCVIKEDSVTLN